MKIQEALDEITAGFVTVKHGFSNVWNVMQTITDAIVELRKENDELKKRLDALERIEDERAWRKADGV